MTQNTMSIFCCSVEAWANVGQASRLSRTCPRAPFFRSSVGALGLPVHLRRQAGRLSYVGHR